MNFFVTNFIFERYIVGWLGVISEMGDDGWVYWHLLNNLSLSFKVLGDCFSRERNGNYKIYN